ncbi:LacI family DNA-binding transcriptional regulator [Cohnella fermenti]|uniref:LacI family transcriptional regulator n=1 Tax=Cohnella fermenti TaxID=2565925 RepID=A0A4S4BNZ9_9BACL|nr:LacI family DNA-binding transcriptional regulator [Cohnella fermenti]THF76568.1 LacI family transcriptional regulator [Cohnella fermenti]
MAQGKKSTIKDVAREANVSISVVSYVLNASAKKSITPETRERVLAAASRLKYVPNHAASGMRRNRSMVIGVVSYWELDGMVFTDMLRGIMREAAGSGYRVMLCHKDSQADDKAYLDYYKERSVDGILFISPHESLGLIDEADHIRLMRESGVPFVMMNGSTNDPDVSYVNVDYHASVYLAASHLIGKGHKEIAYAAPMNLRYRELTSRLQGYRDAMAEAGLPERCVDPAELRDCLPELRAVVANKSDTGHAVLEAARVLGIAVPDQLEVIAANTESYSAYLCPPLSTVRIPAERMGEMAVEMLLRRIDGQGVPEVRTPTCTLELRQTCR